MLYDISLLITVKDMKTQLNQYIEATKKLYEELIVDFPFNKIVHNSSSHQIVVYSAHVVNLRLIISLSPMYHSKDYYMNSIIEFNDEIDSNSENISHRGEVNTIVASFLKMRLYVSEQEINDYDSDDSTDSNTSLD